MHFSIPLLLGSFALGGSNMADPRSLSMKVDESADAVQIELVADADSERVVEYDVEIVGRSRAKHSGRTTITAGPPTSLSRFKVSHDGTWCALATIREQGGLSYSLEAGDCSAFRRS